MNPSASEALYDLKRTLNFYIGRAIDEPIEPPEVLHININFKCNLRCTICTISRKEMELPELSFEEVARMIDEAASMGIKQLLLLGGEPLLRKDIIEIANYAEDRGLSSSIITNGTLIDKNMAEKLALSKVSHIEFSIDGLEKGNDAIRGRGVFKKVINAMDLLQESIVRHNNKRLSIGCTFTITNSNVNQMYDFVQFFDKKYGRNNPVRFELHFQPVVSNNANPQNPIYTTEMVSPKKFDTLHDNIRKIILFIESHKGDKFAVIRAQTERHLLGIERYFKKKLKPEESKCYAGFNRLMTTQRGQFYLCGTAFGNVRVQSLREGWYSEDARRARAMIRNCRTPCLNFCQYIQGKELEMESIEQILELSLQRLGKRGIDFRDKREFIKSVVSFLEEQKKFIKSRMFKNIPPETRQSASNCIEEIESAIRFLNNNANGILNNQGGVQPIRELLAELSKDELVNQVIELSQYREELNSIKSSLGYRLLLRPVNFLYENLRHIVLKFRRRKHLYKKRN